MTAAVGSTGWLLAHELRLACRLAAGAWSRGRRPHRVWLRPVLLTVFFHLCAAPIALGLAMSSVNQTPQNIVVCTCGLLVVWSLMLSQSLHGMVQSIYLRGDLDLLLSSPLSARKILVVKSLTVGVSSVAVWAMLALPLVDMLVVFGQFRWLTVYPILLGLGLSATAVAVVVAMLLFALIGPRKTRTVAQLLAVLIGAVAFILSQTQAFLPDASRTATRAWLAGLADPSHLGLRHPLWIPARALFGELGPMAIFVGLSLALFAVASWCLGRVFAAKVTAVAGSTMEPPANTPAARIARPFRAGTRTALLVKEWRLLMRDPWLISQVLMQVLYLLPLCLIYWRQSYGQHAAIGSIGMIAAVVAGHLAGGLGWITIAGEDAADLLACAPIRSGEVLRAKLTAAMAPVALIVVAPLIGIAFVSLAAALTAAIGCSAAAVSAILLCLWHQRPGKRKAFAARRKGSVFVNLAELALNLLWGFATAFAIGFSPWALLFAGLALLLLFVVAKTASDMPLLAAI